MLTAPAPPALAIVAALSRARLDLSFEIATQDGVEAVLRELLGAGAVQREYVLGPQDRPDFLVHGCIAIEVKIKGARKRLVFRQLTRYAAHERVTALILVTNLAMGLPAEIGGKPVHVVSLGRAWL